MGISATYRKTESGGDGGEELLGVAQMGAVERDNAGRGSLYGLKGSGDRGHSESLAGAGCAADVEACGGVRWLKGGCEQRVNAGVFG